MRPLALADPGMLGDQTRSIANVEAVAMSRSMKAADADNGLDLKPEDITISARVHARFTAA